MVKRLSLSSMNFRGVYKNTHLTRHLYHNSTLQTTWHWSEGLILSKSAIKPFLTRSLYETLFLVPWLPGREVHCTLLRYLYIQVNVLPSRVFGFWANLAGKRVYTCTRMVWKRVQFLLNLLTIIPEFPSWIVTSQFLGEKTSTTRAALNLSVLVISLFTLTYFVWSEIWCRKWSKIAFYHSVIHDSSAMFSVIHKSLYSNRNFFMICLQ